MVVVVDVGVVVVTVVDALLWNVLPITEVPPEWSFSKAALSPAVGWVDGWMPQKSSEILKVTSQEILGVLVSARGQHPHPYIPVDIDPFRLNTLPSHAARGFSRRSHETSKRHADDYPPGNEHIPLFHLSEEENHLPNLPLRFYV